MWERPCSTSSTPTRPSPPNRRRCRRLRSRRPRPTSKLPRPATPGSREPMAAICVFCASSRTLEQRWLDLATETGAEIASRGHTLVSGGGRVGMMGAVAGGARAGGAHTLGIIPQALVDQEVADVDADELVITEGMADRKTAMIEKSDAFLTL